MLPFSEANIDEVWRNGSCFKTFTTFFTLSLSPGVSAVFLFMVEGLRKIGSVKELKLNGDAVSQIENEIDYSKIESMVHSFL